MVHPPKPFLGLEGILMNRRYIPAVHDPILTEMNQKWRRTDQEIADEMGFDKLTIQKYRILLGLPLNTRPRPIQHRDTDRSAAIPKGRQNPLLVAERQLGKRLVEKPSGYWLDGVPVSLDGIMKATNMILKAGGMPQCLHNDRWKV